MEFHVVIPARFDSVRLEGKVLRDIAGKPMIQHVHERAVESGAESVIIATDDERIAEAAEKFNAKVCMTSPEHDCGTERIAEVVDAMDLADDDIIINVQGDEPLMPPSIIRQLAEEMSELDNIKVASVCHPLTSRQELLDPNVVKVVLNRRNFAMYFSRAPIPWDRAHFAIPMPEKLPHLDGYYRHHGIYGYRAGFLQSFLEWQNSPLESLECLEQLRVLWHGGRIHMLVSDKALPPDVNTEADLIRMQELMKNRQAG